jgi:hypothetical protein
MRTIGRQSQMFGMRSQAARTPACYKNIVKFDRFPLVAQGSAFNPTPALIGMLVNHGYEQGRNISDYSFIDPAIRDPHCPFDAAACERQHASR